MNMLRSMNNKGFIGAIGDDLPSLIPIFFAILLFLSSLAYAFVTINQRNDQIDTYINSLKIAKTSLHGGFYSSYEEFKSIKDEILTPSNYIIGLIYRDKGYQEPLVEINEETFIKIENGEVVFCDSEELDHECTLGYEFNDCEEDECYFYITSEAAQSVLEDGFNLVELQKQKKAYVYVYPVGLKTQKGIINVFLLVIVW